MQNIVQIIGLDLGHGETAIAQAYIGKNHDPEMLEIYNQKSQVTALAQKVNGQYVIGERAVRQPGATALDIGFKWRPSVRDEKNAQLRIFMEVIYRELANEGYLRDPYEVCWFIGCPSAWSDEEREIYQNMVSLPDATLYMKIVRESRAALIKARYSKGGQLSVGELRSEILVVDIGSSTTDFTLLHQAKRDEPLDFGYELGASLIDKAILRYTVEQSSERKRIEAIFQHAPGLANRCEMECRQAKEAFFIEIGDLDDPTFASPKISHVETGISLTLSLNGPTMKEILQRPIAELSNRSWIDTFRETLQAVHERLNARKTLPKVLLVTGGASRMSFVQQICAEVFPEARFQRDSEPEFAIAKGLALLGRADIQTAGFMKEVDSTLATVEPLVYKNLPKLIESIAEFLSEGFVTHAIKPSLIEWQKGQIKSFSSVEPRISEHAAAWLQRHAIKRDIQHRVRQWFDPIEEDINDTINRICHRHDIPVDSLRIPLQYDPDQDHLSNLSSKVIRAIFDFKTILWAGLFASVFVPYLWPLIAVGLMSERVRNQLSDPDVPIWFRKRFMSDKKINSIQETIGPKLQQELLNKLNEDPEITTNLVEQISAEIKKDLHDRSDRARILID